MQGVEGVFTSELKKAGYMISSLMTHSVYTLPRSQEIGILAKFSSGTGAFEP